MSNREFTWLTAAAAALLVPGLLVLGLWLVSTTEAATAPNDVGRSLIGGAAISAAFFVVGGLIDRAAARRQYVGEIVTAISADLVELRNAAELARFYIRLNHSAPTYRDRIGLLIRLLGSMREDIELVNRASPHLDNQVEVCRALESVADDLESLRHECHDKYPQLSRVAAAHEKDTSKHQDELENFGALNRLLDIDWRASEYSQWNPSPLVNSTNIAIAAVHGQGSSAGVS